VTSAFHMPRSIGLFRKTGFAVTPWPVDYRTSGREGLGLFRDNQTDTLVASTLAIREWIGLTAYWLTGQIDSPFPGPH
ncbi:MAG: ElyC/SanA/YdcF family protein, partial [Rhizobiaceae bacterium]